jgi:hypothetical protein
LRLWLKHGAPLFAPRACSLNCLQHFRPVRPFEVRPHGLQTISRGIACHRQELAEIASFVGYPSLAAERASRQQQPDRKSARPNSLHPSIIIYSPVVVVPSENRVTDILLEIKRRAR